MLSHNGTRQPDRSWTLSAQPWAPESASAIGCPPATAAIPARAVFGGWDIAAVLALLGVLLGGIAVVAVVQGLDLVRGAAAQRVKICNPFDAAAVTARCTASDPFIVVHQGTTGASLQIDVTGEASRAGVPVTIRVTEDNGAGLVIASGSTRRVLHPDGVGVAVLPLQGVFAGCRISLPTAPVGSPGWERATYTVAVRDRSTTLGETVLHVAL